MGAKGKLRTLDSGYAFYCPGCKKHHVIYRSWQFNGNFERPTFSPSLLVKGYSEKHSQDYVCHSFVTDGEIQFLGDCTHALAGQTVPLMDVEED